VTANEFGPCRDDERLREPTIGGTPVAEALDGVSRRIPRRGPISGSLCFMSFHHSARAFLDRLDRLPPWAFTGTLYLLRWPVILLAGVLLDPLLGPGRALEFDASPVRLLVGFLLIAPLSETLLECALPYWIIRKRRGKSLGPRPWGFVIVSAALMAILHIDAWPHAIVPSLITGSFLAYTYAHFAVRNTRQAILHTTVFHAAINLVGWTMIVAGWGP